MKKMIGDRLIEHKISNDGDTHVFIDDRTEVMFCGDSYNECLSQFNEHFVDNKNQAVDEMNIIITKVKAISKRVMDEYDCKKKEILRDSTPEQIWDMYGDISIIEPVATFFIDLYENNHYDNKDIKKAFEHNLETFEQLDDILEYIVDDILRYNPFPDYDNVHYNSWGEDEHGEYDATTNMIKYIADNFGCKI